MAETTISTNPEATLRRKKELERYYSQYVLRGSEFLCTNFEACRYSHNGSFHQGQLHYVGDYFDARVGHREMRVVVVGQEYGQGPALVDSARRRQMIEESMRAGFRGRNPHMKGTTMALRVLFGRGPGDDARGESLSAGGNRIHLFDAFALVNVLLCSATQGGSRGKATPTMLSNCAPHLQKVLEILQPTVLVCQGKTVVQRVVADVLRVPERTETLFRYSLRGVDGVGVCFNHPSAPRWQWGWSNPAQPYWSERVLPLLNEVRCELGLPPVRPASPMGTQQVV